MPIVSKRCVSGPFAAALCLTPLFGLFSCAGKQLAHENLNAVLWVQTSVEYRALARQSYLDAKLALDEALAQSSWTAATEQREGFSSLPPAVILDVDETVLDNSPYQARLVLDERDFEETTWQAWCREMRATAVPGALEFTRYASSQGVTIFYATNRRKAVEEATVDNLRAIGFPLAEDRDVVLSRGENGWDSSDKTARREHVASRFRVLLLIGDNLGDFVELPGGSPGERETVYERYEDYWGTRWIVLPNPQYGSWESALFDSDFSLTGEERLNRKRQRLRPGS
ncbi:MAG TPA: 5'-nucleotidase, lipoprotein e(P4) family [Vicinamibacteria bacterium]|nr:5'-nucleotidase, lipoprotein e(P4) family [Vicinamibacteria bacterium]